MKLGEGYGSAQISLLSCLVSIYLYVPFMSKSSSREPPTCCQSVSNSFQLVSFPVDFNPDCVLVRV